MDTTMCTGTFKTTRSEDFVKFLTKMGTMSKDECDRMRGTTWHKKICCVEGKWVMVMTCEEMPTLTHIDTFCENTEMECECHPLIASKCKMTMMCTGKDSGKITANTEKFGMIEWTMKWTEDCMTTTWMCKTSGATITEKWWREVKETGWFKMTKADNLETFMMGCGMPSEMTTTCCKDVIIGLDMIGDTWIMTEMWGGMMTVCRYRLDEETTCCIPGMPKMDRKFICTKTGTGKYKTVYMGKNGEKEEWDLEFTTTGLRCIGMDKKSGQSCKMWLEPFTNMCGTFKPTTTTGFHRFGTALGLPTDMVTKLATEMDARLTVCEKDGFVHSMYWSKLVPMNTVFKLNEEYDCTCTGMTTGMPTGMTTMTGMPTTWTPMTTTGMTTMPGWMTGMMTGMTPGMTTGMTTGTTGTTPTTCPTGTTTTCPSTTCTWMTGMTCPLMTGMTGMTGMMGMTGTLGTLGMMGMMAMTGTTGTKLKVMTTRHGNTMTTVTKGPRMTTKTTCKFTDNFVTETTTIVGTDISTTTIMERVTCV